MKPIATHYKREWVENGVKYKIVENYVHGRFVCANGIRLNTWVNQNGRP